MRAGSNILSILALMSVAILGAALRTRAHVSAVSRRLLSLRGGASGIPTSDSEKVKSQKHLTA